MTEDMQAWNLVTSDAEFLRSASFHVRLADIFEGDLAVLAKATMTSGDHQLSSTNPEEAGCQLDQGRCLGDLISTALLSNGGGISTRSCRARRSLDLADHSQS